MIEYLLIAFYVFANVLFFGLATYHMVYGKIALWVYLPIGWVMLLAMIAASVHVLKNTLHNFP